MIDCSNYNNLEKNLNNLNFEKEGEYIMQKKPKYKYELRIVHKNPKSINIDIKRPKTPDLIISSVNFSLLGDIKRKNDNKGNNIIITNKKCNNGKKVSNPNYYFKIINSNNNKCICKKELDRIINQYYGEEFEEEEKDQEKNKYNYSSYENIDKKKNIFLRKKKYIRKGNKLKKDNYFYSPSKNANIYNHKSFDNSYIINDEKISNIKNNNYYNNGHNQRKIIKINNLNNNSFNKGIYSFKKRKRKKKYKNKKIKLSSENIEENKINNNLSNYSFLSVDASKNKTRNQNLNSLINKKEKELNNISIYNIQKKKKKNINNNYNNINSSPSSNSRRSKNNLLINKSSETKQKIKIVPLNKKINPLIIKKFVEKPKIVKILNKDGLTSNIIKQNSVITSIESKRIMNNGKENIVKESITKVYTTLCKKLNEIDDINNNKIIDNNNFTGNNDNININIDKNNIKEKYKEIDIYKDGENNSVFIRRDFKNKNKNKFKLEIINDCNKFDNIRKNYLFNNNINQYQNPFMINKNIKNENLEINSPTIIQKNSDYNSSIDSNYLKFIDNNQITKNGKINSSRNLNNNNNEINKLKITKKNILNSLNDGKRENQKIHKKLKDELLNEKKNKEDEESAIIINKYSFEDVGENININK